MHAHTLQLAAASLVATLAASSLALAQPAHFSSRPAASVRDKIAAYVSEASQRFGVPEAWIMAVMRVESAGDPTATSSAGAMGLMQVMPATYDELRTRLGLGANAYDPHDNIIAGAAYLREMHDRYGAVGFLAAYNAGPGRWEDHLAGVRPLPPETIRYMAQLAPMLSARDANTFALATSPTRVTPEASSLFATLGTLSGNPMAVPATPPRVQLAAAETAAEPQADPMFPERQLAVAPSSNSDKESGDTARFRSRPRVPAAVPTPPLPSPNMLFVPRAPSRERSQ